MKRIIFSILLSLFSVWGCNSIKPKAAEQHQPITTADTLKPQPDIRVNKKYDSRGNLVQYDSTYTYNYSFPGGSMKQLNSDSFYRQFHSLFHSSYDDLLDRNLNQMFFNDSLYKYDFFNPDFFNKRFELNRSMFDNIFKEMDSLKSDALKLHYPNGIMKPKH